MSGDQPSAHSERRLTGTDLLADALLDLLEERRKMREILANVAKHYPQIGPVRDFIDPGWRDR